MTEELEARQKSLERCFEAAKEYVDVRQNHPYLTGQAFRELRSAIEAVEKTKVNQ
jgi:hypothetical protein